MTENTYSNLWINLMKSNDVFLDEENIASLEKIFRPKIIKKEMYFLKELIF